MKRRVSGFDPKDILIAFLFLFAIFEGFLIFRLYTKKPSKAKAPVVKKIAPVVIEKPKKISLGKIAIILDDWGYNADHCENLADIDGALTISVLPELPYSREMAQCAHYNNKEVILHLPLEPHETVDRYPADYVITTSMPKQKIEQLFDKALAGVPFVSGMNNHMGSKATENERFMKIIFSKLKQNNFFFIDSLVTNKTICRRLATQMNIPFGERDIFLDNENNRKYIEGQFNKLKELAQKRGWAIGIGHDRAMTLQVLKEKMDELTREGFQFVTVKQIIE